MLDRMVIIIMIFKFCSTVVLVLETTKAADSSKALSNYFKTISDNNCSPRFKRWKLLMAKNVFHWI